MRVPTSTDTDAFSDVLQSLRTRLENERDRVCREIREYPTPIPRCDAQFNHLLEQRDSIVRELQHFESVADVRNAVEAKRRIEALVDASDFDDALKRELRSIAAGQSGPSVR